MPEVYRDLLTCVVCDKGGGNIRCRLVARDFKTKDSCREDLFAATPPLELLRVMLSKAAGNRRRRKVLVIDAKKARLNPKCDQEVFIELPGEAGAGAAAVAAVRCCCCTIEVLWLL